MKGSAAIAADFLWSTQHAEPMPARGTFRSQTLHRPAGQILHPYFLAVTAGQPKANESAGKQVEPTTPRQTGGIVRRGL